MFSFGQALLHVSLPTGCCVGHHLSKRCNHVLAGLCSRVAGRALDPGSLVSSCLTIGDYWSSTAVHSQVTDFNVHQPFLLNDLRWIPPRDTPRSKIPALFNFHGPTMSGVEIFGIAAGVVQVADVAAKLSVKVYSFARKVKRARQAIEALAKDITGTGAVMKQLGDVLKADQSLELCQPEALSETKRLMDDCGKVFDEIHDIIDGRHKRNGKGKATLRPGSDSGPSLALTMTVRLAYPFLQEQIEVLKAKLDDKKLEVVIMLNVLILGRQVRRYVPKLVTKPSRLG